MKRIISTLLSLLMLISIASALTFDADEFYSKDDIPSALQQTAIGQMLQCSDYPANTYYTWNNRDGTTITSRSVYCLGEPSLINWWRSYDNGATWQYINEYTAPILFNLNTDRDYKWECYTCPDGTLCQDLGEHMQVNSYTYATCVQSSEPDSKAKYWEQTVCQSDQFVNTVSWVCEDYPEPCIPNWEVTQWSECINNRQTRQVIDTNDCGTNQDKPSTSQSCISIECNYDSDCNTGEQCKDGECVDIPPPPPPTCTQGDTQCGYNEILVCSNDEWVTQKTCDNGCAIKQGETQPQCIEKVDDNNTLAIVIGIVIAIFVIVLFVYIGTSKKKK